MAILRRVTRFFLMTTEFLFPTNTLMDVQKIIFIAALFGGFFLFTAGYTFPGGAYQFTDYANALAFGQHLPLAIVQRDAGFPLMLWVSGYPYTKSLLNITIIQTIMAILMPVLVYISVKTVFPRVAYYAGLGTIFSLAPFYYMKWIHHDQTYVFFTVLSICLLTVFIDKKRPIYLYAMTLAVIAASLARPAGNLLFPTFVFVGLLFVRGGFTKYVISIIIALSILFIYSQHRYAIFEMAKYDKMPSFTGEQVFYNLYINSKEYGIRLSPDLGPNMKAMTDNAYAYLLKGPLSKQLEIMTEPDYFLKEYFYPYKPAELMERIYTVPNWEYFSLLCGTSEDQVFLHASLEVARKYPWYVAAFTMRNMWHFLYTPGYAHTRYNINPQGEISLRGAYVLDGVTVQFVNLSERSIRELTFDSYAQQHPLLQKIYNKFRDLFLINYKDMVKDLFYLIIVSWISASVGLLRYIFRFPVLNRLAEILAADKILGPVIGASAILLESILIASMFAEPDYRYHHFLLPLKMILAGFGLGIIIHMIYQLLKIGKLNHFSDVNIFSQESVVSVRRQTISSILLGLFIICIFLCWIQYMIIHTY